MRRNRLLFAGAVLVLLTAVSLTRFNLPANAEKEETEEAETESLWDRYQQEFEQLRDPATGTVPASSLRMANEFTKASQQRALSARTTGLTWQERGPVYDFVGPSNGNSRAGGEYTAGILQSFVVDAADPSGNTVLAGSNSGGLWRCTNFLATGAPNWQPVNDFMANLAVASICQDPTNPSVMYLATGDANTRDVRGYGIWKSTNGGLNWTLLPSTTTFLQAFKILCDNAGNVYLAGGGALNGTSGGLKRSTDGGNTWVNISPTGLTGTNPWYVTDLEISSTGRLHALFGYYGTKVQHFYTNSPATVSSSSGWTESTGIRNSGTACTRIEMATQGNVAYAVTCNSSFNVDSCYKSTDGGATWTLQNTTAYTSAITNTQGWYALELEINPDNPSDIVVGSVDSYRSSDNGATVTRATYWVGFTAPYVHADHHAIKWYKAGGENRMIIGCDGGIFLSRNAGTTFVDRNQNLGIKQFYSCAISPVAGENFLFAGAQDNGCHQLKNPGLSFSTETTGGDGAYVHINQKDPQVQFGTYVYNQYRRSVNGGTSWSGLNLSSSQGYFINPFDYDDTQNILYASNAGASTPNQIRRLNDANTASATASTIVPISAMTRGGTAGNATAFKMSPYTANRLFIGTNRGGLLRLDSANTVTATDADANTTEITGSAFPMGGYLNCVNTGSSDNVLVATFTNYGVSNVWVSTNGGTSWTAVDGNLPDLPVWWAVFVPGNDNKMLIATETGIFSTDALNGSSTVWTAEAGFPLVRTRMLKICASDNTIVAATYGRGLWTASLGGACAAPSITSQPASQTVCKGAAVTFSTTASGNGLSYQWRKNGTAISGATGASYAIASTAAADAGNYDVVVTGSCGSATSSVATLAFSVETTILSQTSSSSVCAGAAASFTVSASGTGTLTYQWKKDGVNIAGATSNSYNITSAATTDAGAYTVTVTGSCGSVTSSNAVLTVTTGGGCVTAVPTVDPSVTSVSLLPNLIQQNAVLRTNVQRPMTVNWQVVDAQGKVVMRFTQRLSAGKTDLPLQLGKLAAGRYYLAGSSDKGKLETLRFTKL